MWKIKLFPEDVFWRLSWLLLLVLPKGNLVSFYWHCLGYCSIVCVTFHRFPIVELVYILIIYFKNLPKSDGFSSIFGFLVKLFSGQFWNLDEKLHLRKSEKYGTPYYSPGRKILSKKYFNLKSTLADLYLKTSCVTAETCQTS